MRLLYIRFGCRQCGHFSGLDYLRLHVTVPRWRGRENDWRSFSMLRIWVLICKIVGLHIWQRAIVDGIFTAARARRIYTSNPHVWTNKYVLLRVLSSQRSEKNPHLPPKPLIHHLTSAIPSPQNRHLASSYPPKSRNSNIARIQRRPLTRQSQHRPNIRPQNLHPRLNPPRIHPCHIQPRPHGEIEDLLHVVSQAINLFCMAED